MEREYEEQAFGNQYGGGGERNKELRDIRYYPGPKGQNSSWLPVLHEFDAMAEFSDKLHKEVLFNHNFM